MADHCRKSCDDVHAHGHDHDCDLDDDDGVETILVEFFVYLSLLFGTIVHSMPLERFVFAVPCHAYQHFEPTPLMSMNVLNFVTQCAAERHQYVKIAYVMD